MITFADLLKHKQPDAVDKMTDVAANTWADKFGANPSGLTAEQIDALNQNPEILDRVNQARAKMVEAKAAPVAEPATPAIDVPEVPITKTIAPLQEMANEESGLLAKLKNIPEETLAKMGPLGQKIMQSRAMGTASNVLNHPATGVLGLGAESYNLAQAVDKGDSGNALGAGMGMGSGALAMAGSAGAIPAAAATLAYRGGQETGGMAKEYLAKHPEIEMDDRGNFAQNNMRPKGEPTPVDASNMQLAGSDVPPPSGRGPVADVNKYNPSFTYDHMFDGPQQEVKEERKLAQESSGGSGSSETSTTSNTETEKLQKMLELLKSEPGFSNDTVANLKAQQDAANKTKDLNAALRNLNLFSSGLVGGRNAVLKPNQESFDLSDKMADDKVTQFKELTAKEADDPNSNYSQQYKAYISPLLKELKINPAILQNASAKQIKDLLPFTQKMYEGQENRIARADVLKDREADRKAITEYKHSEKQSQLDTKRMDTLGKMLESQLASSRSGFGKDALAINTIQNVKALFDGEANLDDLDNRQVVEVARVLDRVLSGGQPTISGTEHLTPDSARMKAAKYLEFATSKRQGAGAGDFVKNMQHTFEREEDIAQKRIDNTSQSVVGSYLDIAERNPEAWDAMMAQKNLLGSLGTEALRARKSKGLKNRKDHEEAERKPSANKKFDSVTEEKIQKAMKANNASREEIIEGLSADPKFSHLVK